MIVFTDIGDVGVKVQHKYNVGLVPHNTGAGLVWIMNPHEPL